MPEKIPPKGQTGVEIEVTPEKLGADVTIRMRSLTLAPKMKDPKRAMLFAWRALGGELAERGVNLYAAMAEMPEPMQREDLSDGSEPGTAR